VHIEWKQCILAFKWFFTGFGGSEALSRTAARVTTQLDHSWGKGCQAGAMSVYTPGTSVPPGALFASRIGTHPTLVTFSVRCSSQPELLAATAESLLSPSEGWLKHFFDNQPLTPTGSASTSTSWAFRTGVVVGVASAPLRECDEQQCPTVFRQRFSGGTFVSVLRPQGRVLDLVYLYGPSRLVSKAEAVAIATWFHPHA